MTNDPRNPCITGGNIPARAGSLRPFRADAGHYLQALLKAGEAEGRVTLAQAQDIRFELERMLQRMAVTYTFGASSSMPAETAKQLLASASYAIGLALKCSPTPDAALEQLLSTPPDELRREGLSVIDAMVRRAGDRLAVLQAAPVTGNRAYLDTIGHGLPLFFSSYDKTYAAHESPGSIDYPLCVDICRLTGIEYTDTYIEALSVEAAFLSRWPRADIDALLRGYSPGWCDLLINTFERAMVNSLGRVLCGLDLSNLNLTADNRAYLAETLTGLPPARLRALLGVTLGRLGLDDNCLAYARQALTGIAASIKTALETGHPVTVFVTPAAPSAPMDRFIDGPRMDDNAFRALTEAVRECRHMPDKLVLIKGYVKSLKDLIDLLGASCLSGDDFVALFAGLDPLTLRQLATSLAEDEFHLSAAEQDWHAALTEYLRQT